MAKQTQLDKFKQAARELETDDDEKRFDEQPGVIAKQPQKLKAKEHAQSLAGAAPRSLYGTLLHSRRQGPAHKAHCFAEQFCGTLWGSAGGTQTHSRRTKESYVESFARVNN
jgi:hypothetical protein